MSKTVFEILSETGKVHCQTCLVGNDCEPWILRSSAQAHLKSDHHHKREIANKRYKETRERLDQNFCHDAEQSAAMWNEFLAPGAIPSIQVNPQETVAPAHSALMEEDHEQADWLCDFINQTTDTPHPRVDKHDRSLDDWLAATFGDTILMGEDEEDETVPNVLNAACLFFYQLGSEIYNVSHIHLDSKMPLDEFESFAFGKPFPDRKTEWYPYDSNTVCCITLTMSLIN